jgi:UDP-N-acetyl-D-glucosamine dehydrogenase
MIVGVLGLGYVGLPLCREFVRGGCEVIGFDIDHSKIEQLQQSKSYIKHISDESVSEMISSGRFSVTSDMERLSQPEAILITVPTPLNTMREPDLSYVENSCREIAHYLRKGQLIVLESTTYPGTTKEVVKPILEQESGLVCGKDFFLAYSPEREDPGREDFTTKTIPKVVGGISDESLRRAVELYQKAVDHPVPVENCEVAEASKILENTYRCVNIALVNELKTLFDRMDINIWEVIKAAETKPFGFTPFYPGPGLGGHCIPIDPFYLSWKAREYDLSTKFIELAGEINCSMPSWVISKTADALNTQGKPLKGSRVLLVGLAYKANVDDDRESPSFKLMKLLEEKGSLVDYYDPYVPVVGNKREYPQYTGKKSVQLSEAVVSQYDCVLISTNHSLTDYKLITSHAQLVVDTRNVVPDAPHVFRA